MILQISQTPASEFLILLFWYTHFSCLELLSNYGRVIYTYILRWWGHAPTAISQLSVFYGDPFFMHSFQRVKHKILPYSTSDILIWDSRPSFRYPLMSRFNQFLRRLKKIYLKKGKERRCSECFGRCNVNKAGDSCHVVTILSVGWVTKWWGLCSRPTD